MTHTPGVTDDNASDAPDEKEEDKKERVLHTRVPAVLEGELKKLAKTLRVPVSNVVRAILEDAVEVAERAGKKTEEGLRGWAERLHDERDRLRERVRNVGAASSTPTSSVPGANEAKHNPEVPTSKKEDRPHRSGETPLKGVLGFQPFILVSTSECALCGRSLDEGEEALIGFRENGTSGPLIGPECLPGSRKSPP